MTALWLDPQALAQDPEILAKLIVTTAAAAAQVAIDRQNSVVDELNDRMRALQEVPLTMWDGTIVDAP
jgi:hypothetical protein